MGCVAMVKPVADGPTLLDRVEAFLAEHGIPPTRFGWDTVRSVTLVQRLRQGKTFHRKTLDRIEEALANPPQYRPRTRSQVVASHYRQAMQDNFRADLAERERRLTDPVERAATFIRQRGWQVYRASVHDSALDGWFVGSTKLSDPELIARAFKYGWGG